MNTKTTSAETEAAQNQSTMPDDSDLRLGRRIRELASRGNDVEVRRKKDGSLAVYELRRHLAND